MSVNGAVKFIRRAGHIIPIRPGIIGKRASVAVGKGAAGIVASKSSKNNPIKAHKGLKAAGFGLAVASGVLGAATFASGTRAFLGGAAVGAGLDIASSSLNIAAHAGKGHAKLRTKAALKQEAINQAAGWGVFGAGLLAMGKNRALVKQGAKNFGMKLTSLIRRV